MIQLPEYWCAGFSFRVRAGVWVRISDSVGIQVSEFWGVGTNVRVMVRVWFKFIVLGCKYPSSGVRVLEIALVLVFWLGLVITEVLKYWSLDIRF